MTAPPERRWQWCVSTLGCSDRPYEEICELADEFGIRGIELRGIDGRMDMPDYCAERDMTPSRMTRLCRKHRTRLAVVGSSVKLTSASEDDRLELLAFGAWAEALAVPYLRVFGGGVRGSALTDSDYTHAADVVNWWRDQRQARGWKVDLVLETHDAFSGSEPCLRLNQHLAHPVALIWDSHHTWRVGGEPPHSTWDQVGPLVRHVHLKDSVDRPSARHPYTYVLPGEGQMPMGEVIETLDAARFHGFVSLEWERLWHPYLPPLREALRKMVLQPWFPAANDDPVDTSSER